MTLFQKMVLQKAALLLCGFFATAGSAWACEITLQTNDPSVLLSPSDGVGSTASARFEIELANTSAQDCSVVVAIANRPESEVGMLPIEAIGPNGVLRFSSDIGEPVATGQNSFSVIVPGNEQRRIPIELRLPIAWGDRAGQLEGLLRVAALNSNNNDLLSAVDVNIQVAVPEAVQIRTAGDIQQLDLGELSSTEPTGSSPFAVRVLSTAPYRITIDSENNGLLRRAGGDETIAYRMAFGEHSVDFATVTILNAGIASASGDVYPILITVPAVPGQQAGIYQDQVTISVLAL